MTTFLRLVMLLSLLSFVSVLAAGCGHMTKSQTADAVIAVGGDALLCAAGDAGDVRNAITHGGADWLSVVVAAFQCIPQIVKDIELATAVAAVTDPFSYYVADAVANVAPVPESRLTRGAKRRLAAAKVIGQMLNAKVKP